jgi:hypothetical protein
MLDVPSLREEEASPEQSLCDEPELDFSPHAKCCDQICRDNDTVEDTEGRNTMQKEYRSANEDIIRHRSSDHAENDLSRFWIVRYECKLQVHRR